MLSLGPVANSDQIPNIEYLQMLIRRMLHARKKYNSLAIQYLQDESISDQEKKEELYTGVDYLESQYKICESQNKLSELYQSGVDFFTRASSDLDGMIQLNELTSDLYSLIHFYVLLAIKISVMEEDDNLSDDKNALSKISSYPFLLMVKNTIKPFLSEYQAHLFDIIDHFKLKLQLTKIGVFVTLNHDVDIKEMSFFAPLLNSFLEVNELAHQKSKQYIPHNIDELKRKEWTETLTKAESHHLEQYSTIQNYLKALKGESWLLERIQQTITPTLFPMKTGNAHDFGHIGKTFLGQFKDLLMLIKEIELEPGRTLSHMDDFFKSLEKSSSPSNQKTQAKSASTKSKARPKKGKANRRRKKPNIKKSDAKALSPCASALPSADASQAGAQAPTDLDERDFDLPSMLSRLKLTTEEGDHEPVSAAASASSSEPFYQPDRILAPMFERSQRKQEDSSNDNAAASAEIKDDSKVQKNRQKITKLLEMLVDRDVKCIKTKDIEKLTALLGGSITSCGSGSNHYSIQIPENEHYESTVCFYNTQHKSGRSGLTISMVGRQSLRGALAEAGIYDYYQVDDGGCIPTSTARKHNRRS